MVQCWKPQSEVLEVPGVPRSVLAGKALKILAWGSLREAFGESLGDTLHPDLHYTPVKY